MTSRSSHGEIRLTESATNSAGLFRNPDPIEIGEIELALGAPCGIESTTFQSIILQTGRHSSVSSNNATMSNQNPSSAPSNKNRMFQATMWVTVVIFISKAFGFVRDAISAGYFTKAERDIFNSAYSLFYLPVLLFSSCITSTLIPLYIDARDLEGKRSADHFASNCINMFAVFSLAVGLFMMFLSDPLVHLIYGGYDVAKREAIAQLTRIMMPSLMFVVLSIVLSSVLNANERYVAAQLTGFPLSFAMIAGIWYFMPRYGLNAVAWSVFVAGILQVLILAPSLSKSMRYSLHMHAGDSRFKRMLLLALPSMASMAVSEVNHMVDKSVASYLQAGDLSSMDYAFRLITFATGVLCVPITTVMFSKISKHAAARNLSGAREMTNQTIEALALILLPITVIGCVLSYDVIQLAYGRNQFGHDAVLVTAGVFAFYLVGVLGFAVRDVYNRVFHAFKDTKTPLYVAVASVILHIGMTIALSRVMGANGMALATSISGFLSVAALMILLHKKIGHMGLRATSVQLGKMGLAAVACLICVLGLHHVIPRASGTLMLFFRLCLITGASIIVYVGCLMAMKVEQLEFVHRRLRKR